MKSGRSQQSYIDYLLKEIKRKKTKFQFHNFTKGFLDIIIINYTQKFIIISDVFLIFFHFINKNIIIPLIVHIII